nr:hypothetical protein [Mesorhizobium sp.]
MAEIDEGRERMAAQLFRDRLDLPVETPCTYISASVATRTLVTLEQLGAEAAGPVLRDPQLKLADTGDKSAAIIARAIAEPLRCALAFRSTQRLVHLGLEHLLHRRTDHFAQTLRGPKAECL